MDAVEQIKTHIGTDYFDLKDSKKETIKVEPILDHINYKTIWGILGYRDIVNMDAPVWTNSICNELGRLSQGWKKHAGTDTIEFVFRKEKPKEIRSTYVRVVCYIRPHKAKTHRTRITSGGESYILSSINQHNNIKLNHHENPC